MNTTEQNQIEIEILELKSLLTDVAVLLSKIAIHPHYKRLLANGYSPDLNIADAQTAISYLEAEV
ncbi:hypothetical protein NIES25_70100 (plasmid) [Nostoc linckia NIES-25]|nr:hypothetical protein NIES25_70100 [Nostoc linckia NIES-25]